MHPFLRQLTDAFRMLSFVVFILSGLAMLWLWVTAMWEWLSWPGLLLGLLSAPLAALHPFIRWLVDGTFPTSAFAIWAAGVAGLTISMLWGFLETRNPPGPPPAGSC